MHRGLEVRPSRRSGSWRVGVVSRAVMELLCVGTKGWRSVAAATSRRRVPTAKVTFVAHLKSLCRSPVHSSYGRQPLYVGRYETYARSGLGRRLLWARLDAYAGVLDEYTD